jgi:hypothetical protein
MPTLIRLGNRVINLNHVTAALYEENGSRTKLLLQFDVVDQYTTLIMMELFDLEARELWGLINQLTMKLDPWNCPSCEDTRAERDAAFQSAEIQLAACNKAEAEVEKLRKKIERMREVARGGKS